LKERGIANGGMNVPQRVCSDREVEWLCYGASLAMTLQRLAHITGDYEKVRAEAEALGLSKPLSPAP
jgi:hypothetical protein